MTLDPPDADEARTELYDIMQRPVPFEEKARLALELGRAYLGVENAHLTRVDADTEFWQAVVSTDQDDGAYPAGLVLDLGETYCRRVVEGGTTVALHDAAEQGWADDPAYAANRLATYHGTALTVDGEVLGTLCFVDAEPRDAPFTEGETLFAELVARMLEHELRLARREHELSLQTGVNTVLSRVLRHNLRNDLNVVYGVLDLLAERAPDSADLLAVGHRKIDDLVALAAKARQVESLVHADRERQPVELTRLVRQVVDGVRRQYPGASFTVESDGEVVIKARPTLRRALAELVENAAKHGGAAPNVTVTVEGRPDTVRLEVRDDGPGIPADELSVLDEGTETPLVHGSGLGLWLVHLIVAGNDGTVDPVVTEAGTTVTLELPRADLPREVADHDALLGLFNREQDRFEAVFEESFDAMVVLDDDGRCLEANERATELFACERADLLGRRADAFVPDDLDLEAIRRAFHSDRDQGVIPVVAADGTERLVEYSASADIIPGQHLAILRDVTERVEREERYDAIFNSMYQFTGLLAPDGTVLEANDTALEFGGLDPTEVVGRKLWETAWFQASTETRRRARAAVERAAEGEFVRETLTVQGADRQAVIDFSVRPVTDEAGTVTYLVPEGRDITGLEGGPTASNRAA